MTNGTHTHQHGSDALPLDPPLGAHDLRQLAREIEALHAMQYALMTAGYLEKILNLLPRPGWTTPAEFALVRGQIRHMAELVQGLEKAQATLLRGANMVGQR